MRRSARLVTFLTIFMAVTGLGLYSARPGSIAAAPAVEILGPFVGAVVTGTSFDGDVRSLRPALSARRAAEATPLPRLRAPRASTQRGAPRPAAALPTSQVTVAPRRSSPAAAPLIVSSFSGISQTTFADFNAWPPDPTGDVGRAYYVQAVNRSIGIYDKAGTPLASFSFNSFFTGTGTLCDTNQRDDPSVVYDYLSDRWMFTFFAFSDPYTKPFYQCFAVSKGSNPVTGGWWLYGMLADPSWLDDYPKFSLWPDGFYMTANMFRLGDNFKGVRVWALDRSAMMSGTLRSVSFDLPWDGYCCFSLLPATVRGTSPPVGSPDYFLDAETSNPGSALHLWKFHVDWSQPLSSTFTGPTTLAVNVFDSTSGVTVPQKGSTEQVDGGDSNLMTPLQYRLINGTESLWASQGVVSGVSTGIRWYEIRDPNGSPLVYQQGTFNPDSKFRWMPSLSVDAQGNMAVGYSVSSSSMYPAIRVTGRLATDPLGVLDSLEASIIEGTGSQLHGFSRWGDYSAMSVDPSDDCTFWFTDMYYQTTGSDWQTRIGSFSFPTCPRPTAVTLNQLSVRSIAGEGPPAGFAILLSLLGLAVCCLSIRRILC